MNNLSYTEKEYVRSEYKKFRSELSKKMQDLKIFLMSNGHSSMQDIDVASSDFVQKLERDIEKFMGITHDSIKDDADGFFVGHCLKKFSERVIGWFFNHKAL